MNRAIAVVVLSSCATAALAAAGVTVPPRPARYATDRAGVIEASRLRALDDRLAQFERDTSNQVLVYVDRRVPAGTTLEEFANAAFHAWGLGQKGKDNGVALFVFVDDRKFRFEVGYGLEGAIPDARTVQIGETCLVPKLRAGDYAGGLDQTVTELMKAARGEAFTGTGRTAAETQGSEPLAPWVWLLPIVGLAAGAWAARGGKSTADSWIRGSVTTGLVSFVATILGVAVSHDGRFVAAGFAFLLLGAAPAAIAAIGLGTTLTGRRRFGLALMQLAVAMGMAGFALICLSVSAERFARFGIAMFAGCMLVGLLGRFLEAEDLGHLLTLGAFAIGIAGTVFGGLAVGVAYLTGTALPSIAYAAPAAALVLALSAWLIARSRGWSLLATGPGGGGSSDGWSSSGDSWSSSGSDSSFSGGGGDSGGGGSSGDW